MAKSVLVLLLLYLGVVVFIGVSAARRAKSGEAHAIAKHKAPTWRVAASLFTLLGGGELVAMTSLSYSYSYAAMWFFGGVAAGFVTLALVVRRIRTEEHVKNYTGLADFFFERFGKSASSAVALIIVLAFGALLMVQYIVGAGLLALFLNWPYPIVVLGMSAIIVLYLTLGGFEAVLDTDVLQAIVMVVAAIIIVAGTFSLMGGVASTKPVLPMGKLDSALFFFPAWLAVVGSADVWQVLFAAKSSPVARTGLLLAGGGFTLFGIFFGYLGNLTRQRVPALANPDDAFATAIGQVLPPNLLPAGIILIFAAVMSTADTEIFVVSRTLVREFVHHSKRKITLDEERGYTRAAISYVALAGALLAIFATQGTLATIYFAVLGLALALTPAMVAAWFWQPPRQAIIFSVLAAPAVLAVAAVAKYLSPTNAPLLALIASTSSLAIAWAIWRTPTEVRAP